MKALGLYLNKIEVKQLMNEVDIDNNGTIDLKEFTQLMKQRFSHQGIII